MPESGVVKAVSIAATEAIRFAWLYGLGIVLAILITLAFLFVIWYVLITNDRREQRLAQIVSDDITRLQRTSVEQTAAIRALTESIQDSRDKDSKEHSVIVGLLEGMKGMAVS